MSSSKKKPSLISRLFFSRIGLFLTSWLLRAITSALYSTLQIRLRGLDSLKQSVQDKCLIALWHDQLFLAPLIRSIILHKPLGIVVSKSRDGQMLGAYASTFTNVFCIYVAHNGRHKALLQMVDALEADTLLLITPDGPKGPKHVVKEGALFCAEKAKARIVGMSWQASNAWKLNTWDKMQIPKPFSKVTICFSEAILDTHSLEKCLTFCDSKD